MRKLKTRSRPPSLNLVLLANGECRALPASVLPRPSNSHPSRSGLKSKGALLPRSKAGAPNGIRISCSRSRSRFRIKSSSWSASDRNGRSRRKGPRSPASLHSTSCSGPPWIGAMVGSWSRPTATRSVAGMSSRLARRSGCSFRFRKADLKTARRVMAAASWLRRFDILVQAEEISWIVFGLQRAQSRVILAIGGFNALRSFLTEIVGVNTSRRKRSHRFPQLARPADAHRIFCRIVPDRNRETIVQGIAVCVRCSSSRHAGDRSANMLQYQQRFRRGARVGGQERIDRRVRQLAQELRLPIISASARKNGIRTRLSFQV